jgi:hypothetical protein
MTKVLGFPVAEPDSPAADSIPAPLVGLGFTLILIVSPSYNSKLWIFNLIKIQ